MMGDRALFHRKISDSLQLRFVPIHDRRMDLERQSRFSAVLHAAHRAFPRTGKRAKLIVLSRVEGVKGNAHTHRPRSFQFAGLVLGNQRAVRPEDGPQAGVRRVTHQFQNVETQQRLAAGKNHDLETGAGNLADHFLRLGGGQLVLRLAARIAVTMRAVHIAGVRRVPGNNHSPISSSVK